MLHFGKIALKTHVFHSQTVNCNHFVYPDYSIFYNMLFPCQLHASNLTFCSRLNVKGKAEVPIHAQVLSLGNPL